MTTTDPAPATPPPSAEGPALTEVQPGLTTEAEQHIRSIIAERQAFSSGPDYLELLMQALDAERAARAEAEARLRALAEWTCDEGGWRLFEYAASPPPAGIFDLSDRINPAVALATATPAAPEPQEQNDEYSEVDAWIMAAWTATARLHNAQHGGSPTQPWRDCPEPWCRQLKQDSDAHVREHAGCEYARPEPPAAGEEGTSDGR